MTSETFGEQDPATPAAALEQLERAETLTHTRYPKLGSWYPPAVGALVAIWIASFAAPGPLDVIGMFATVLALSVLTGVYTRRRGVTPNIRQAPKELKRVVVAYFVVYGVFIGGCAMMWQRTTWWITALVAGAVAAGGTAFYERRYAEAARAAEARVGVADVPVAR